MLPRLLAKNNMADPRYPEFSFERIDAYAVSTPTPSIKS